MNNTVIKRTAYTQTHGGHHEAHSQWLDRPQRRDPDDHKAAPHELLLYKLDTADVEPGTGPDYGHFHIFYNDCTGTACDDEEVTHADVELMADFVECAWALFVDPTMSSDALAFHDILDSDWLDHPDDPTTTSDDYISVWIDRSGGGGRVFDR